MVRDGDVRDRLVRYGLLDLRDRLLAHRRAERRLDGDDVVGELDGHHVVDAAAEIVHEIHAVAELFDGHAALLRSLPGIDSQHLEAIGAVVERRFGELRVEGHVVRPLRYDVVGLLPPERRRHHQISHLAVIVEVDLARLVAGDGVRVDQLVLADQVGLGVHVQRHLQGVDVHEGDDVVRGPVHRVLADIAQRGITLQRRAQDERREPALVLGELLLLGGRGVDRRGGAVEQIERLPLVAGQHDAGVAAEPRASRGLHHRQTVLFEVDDRLLLEATWRIRRLRGRHLKAGRRLAVQPDSNGFHTFDGCPAPDGVHGGVQHPLRALVRTLHRRLRIVCCQRCSEDGRCEQRHQYSHGAPRRMSPAG